MSLNPLLMISLLLIPSELLAQDKIDQAFWAGYKVGCEEGGGTFVARNCIGNSSGGGGGGTGSDVMSNFIGNSGSGAIILGGTTEGYEIPDNMIAAGGLSDAKKEEIISALRNGDSVYFEGYRMEENVVDSGKLKLALTGKNKDKIYVPTKLPNGAQNWAATGELKSALPEADAIAMMQGLGIDKGFVLKGMSIEKDM